jgi:Protein of unknown function (DUF2845)
MKRSIKVMLISWIVAAALLSVASVEALDMDLRCGSNIVSVGERTHDVLRKCGPPVSVESWQEVRVRGDIGFGSWVPEPGRKFYIGSLFVNELVTIEEWEYNLGPNRFTRYLTFENGRLTSVNTGDYGY